MTDLTLYHFKHARSLRVIWALEELELAYQLQVVERELGNTGGESYRDINPLQKVPALMVDGERLLESTAILEYLATKLGEGKLALSTDHPEYGRYLQWLHGGESGFGMYVSLFLGHSMLLPEENRIPQLAEWSFDHIKKMFVLFGEELGEDEWAAGSEFTIADISLGYVAFICGFVKPVMTFVPPNVNKWWGRCQGRSAWNRAMRINMGRAEPTARQ